MVILTVTTVKVDKTPRIEDRLATTAKTHNFRSERRETLPEIRIRRWRRNLVC